VEPQGFMQTGITAFAAGRCIMRRPEFNMERNVHING